MLCATCCACRVGMSAAAHLLAFHAQLTIGADTVGVDGSNIYSRKLYFGNKFDDPFLWHHRRVYVLFDQFLWVLCLVGTRQKLCLEVVIKQPKEHRTTWPLLTTYLLWSGLIFPNLSLSASFSWSNELRAWRRARRAGALGICFFISTWTALSLDAFLQNVTYLTYAVYCQLVVREVLLLQV